MKNKCLFYLFLCCVTLSWNGFAQELNNDSSGVVYYPVKENFLSKGRSNVSFSAGFEEQKVEDDYLLTLLKIEQIKSQKYDFSIGGNYFISDNVAIGGKVSYGFYDKTYHLDAKVLELLIDAQNYSTSTAKSIFAFGGGVKHFVPMGAGRKFFIFNETYLFYSYSQTLTRDVYNNSRIEKNMWYDNSIAIKLSPGVMYFLTKGFAFEFSLTPVSLGYKWGTVTHNEVSKGSSHDAALDFSFFPFNIYFGFSYYFN
ncbi:MAG: hypothetical protein LBO06_03290 [Bacteroidales bacterium]|jgi:hypothetical protein|nr:hypothetical protein [Bacteroidales bacterium]